MSARSCGTCSLCCKVMGVTSIAKPRNVWCVHARTKNGCAIHEAENYPTDCREFECAWVERATLAEELRPDRCHALITGVRVADGSDNTSMREGIVVHVDPGYPNAWREPPLKPLIDRMVVAGLRVIVAVGSKRHMFLSPKSVVTIAQEELREVPC